MLVRVRRARMSSAFLAYLSRKQDSMIDSESSTEGAVSTGLRGGSAPWSVSLRSLVLQMRRGSPCLRMAASIVSSAIFLQVVHFPPRIEMRPLSEMSMMCLRDSDAVELLLARLTGGLSPAQLLVMD